MTFKKEYQKTKSSKEETYEQWLERMLLNARAERNTYLDKAISLQESEIMLLGQVRQLTGKIDYLNEELAQAKSSLRNCKDELELLLQKGESLEKHNDELQTECEELKAKCEELACKMHLTEIDLNDALVREYKLNNGSQPPEDRLKKSLTGLVEAMKALEDFCNKHKAQFPKGSVMQEPKLRTKVDEHGKPYQVPSGMPQDNPDWIVFDEHSGLTPLEKAMIKHNLIELFDRIASEVHKKPKPLITIKGDINYWRKPGEQTPYKAAVRRDSPTYNDLKQLMKEADKCIIPYTEIAKRLGLPIGKPLGITINKSKIVVRVLKQKQRNV